MNRRLNYKNRFEFMDFILLIVLTVWGLAIFLPFLNVVAISVTGHREYLETPLLIWPKALDLKSYSELFNDSRIWIGYRTTLTILGIGVPLSLFLISSMAYALSRRNYPGRKFIFLAVLFTMLFQGGIVPLYLLVKSLGLTNQIWSVILVTSMNTFYMILMYNYFNSLPESLIESARLDGAGEWTILYRIILPLSKPILATVVLFLCVDRWNEWFNAMIFIRKSELQPLQLVLRSIVIDSQILDTQRGSVSIEETPFSMGIKMTAVMATMLPIMLVYPFLQRHFTKGIMIGAIKS